MTLLGLAGWVLIFAGLVWAAWSILVLGFRRFVGLQAPLPSLIMRGPYRYMRHPFCVGGLVTLLGLFAATGDGIFGALVAVAIVISIFTIRIEERRLLARFGEAYQRYRQVVPALIPRMRRLRRTSGNSDHAPMAS